MQVQIDEGPWLAARLESPAWVAAEGGPNGWDLDSEQSRQFRVTQKKLAWLYLEVLEAELGGACPGRAHHPVTGV